MTEQKKPLAGEWWEKDGCRVRVVGHRLDGAAITETHGGFIGLLRVIEGWKHLTGCDSFEWQPETFPQWYVSGCDEPWIAHAYLKRISCNTYERYRHNGEKDTNEIWGGPENGIVSGGYWKQVTQAEAESRIKKPEPVESPDDWVTQDRVPDRPGIDQWRWVYGGKSEGDWRDTRSDSDIYLKHGYVDAAMDRFEVRCRRKDLPSMPQETPKPSYVRLWTHRTSGTVCTATDEKYLKYPDIWTELKHDGTGFYLAAD